MRTGWRMRKLAAKEVKGEDEKKEERRKEKKHE